MAGQAAISVPGGGGCPGCGGSIACRLIMNTLGPNTVVEASCPCAGGVAYRGRVPGVSLMYSNAGSAGAGLVAAMKARKMEDVNVVAFAGDGGAADIGMLSLSGCAERNENMLFVCLDNEAYMMTGVQKSGSTPFGARTATTPVGKATRKKDLARIMLAHGVPYVATATVAYPQDLIKKVEKTKEIKGFKYLHVLVPCPPGWGTPAEKTIEYSRLAVESGVFPLWEAVDGQVRFTVQPKEGVPVSDYLKGQNRFRTMSDDMAEQYQDDVDDNVSRLTGEAGLE